MHLLDLIFPKRCLGCGKWGVYICSSCKKTIPSLSYLKCPVCGKPAIDGITHPKCKTKYALDGLISFFRYDGIIKKAIKEIKYRYVSSIIGDLISCIPDNSGIHTSYILNHKSIIIPIPLHPSRYRERGFNQAEILAHVLSRCLEIPVKSDFLIRTEKTVPQVTMKDREKRLKNMQNVFTIHKSYITYPKSNIILIDDVFTTGATLRSAASVLKHAGAESVFGITIAQ